MREALCTQGAQVFFFGVGWQCWISVLPNGFPSSKCVLQHVPNSFSVYPISFAICSILNNQALNWPKGGDYDTYILGQCKAEGLINVFGDGPIKHAHHKRKKKLNFECHN